MRLELSARPPFSLQQVINSHGWPQLAPFLWDRASGELRRVERLASGRVVELRFDQTHDGAAVEIDVDLPADEQAEVEAKVQWMLGLDQDFSAFYTATRGEPKLTQAEVQAMSQVSREWYGGQRVGEKEVNAAFQHWGEWKGLAFWCWEWAA
jgi:hypothetical protein